MKQSTNSQAMKEEQEVLYNVLQEAWKDPEFRKRLVQNPVEEIERLTGARIVLPEGKTLVVNDQTDTSKFFLNIPTHPDDIDLTESQLDAMTGGAKLYSPISSGIKGLISCITLSKIQ